MRLDPAAFNRFLGEIGQQVAWRRSYACACLNPASGAPDPKHALCAGKGRLWNAPVQTVCGITRQDVSPELIAAGLFDAGDMQMTIPSSSPMWRDAGRIDGAEHHPEPASGARLWDRDDVALNRESGDAVRWPYRATRAECVKLGL